MTTLYKPVKIESAEQAEALPVGTVALAEYHGAAIRCDYGLGWSVAGEEMSVPHEEVLGGTALVPIEARRQEPTDIIDLAFDAPPTRRSPRTHRYCTAWEEA